MEPGAIQISHSNTIDQNFQTEEKIRRQQAIDLRVARQNFQDRMKSRDVFHNLEQKSLISQGASDQSHWTALKRLHEILA